MNEAIDKDVRIRSLLAAALGGTLTERQAEELAALDAGLAKLAWLAAARRIAELQAKLAGPAKIDPATPSGQRPLYTKPSPPKRKGKPGAKKGHAGGYGDRYEWH